MNVVKSGLQFGRSGLSVVKSGIEFWRVRLSVAKFVVAVAVADGNPINSTKVNSGVCVWLCCGVAVCVGGCDA